MAYLHIYLPHLNLANRRNYDDLSGPVVIKLASNDFEADTLHGEDPSLTKIELDFHGREFEKQFACRFKVSMNLSSSDYHLSRRFI